MKRILIAVATMAAVTSQVVADEYVKGYVRKDGSYVAPHWRSSPNSTPYDNYSTQGNVNPYTGQRGTESQTNQYQPYQPYQPYQYKPRGNR